MVQSAALKDYITAYPHCLDLAVPLWIIAMNGRRSQSEVDINPPSPVWVVAPSLSIRTSIKLSEHPVWLPSSSSTSDSVHVHANTDQQQHRHYNHGHQSQSQEESSNGNVTLSPFKAGNLNHSRSLSTSSADHVPNLLPHHRYLVSPKSKLSYQLTNTCLTDLTALLNISHYPTSSYKATRASTHIFW